jgi:hypothetical protein
MRHSVKQYASLFFVTIICFCLPIEESQVEGELEVYIARYTVDFINNTDFDIVLSMSSFVFPSDDPLVNTCFQTVLKNNSKGSFPCKWSYTRYDFVREPFTDPGDFIRSFYLRLDLESNEYFIAGWPEDVYSLDNTVSYGHGWGFGRSSIGVIQEGELLKFVFAPDFSKESTSISATV